jgi:hypothetical protein
MTPLERSIKERIRSFELVALLRLLAHHGWRPEELVFQSHHSQVSQGSLLQDIEFEVEPHRQAVISLNVGLLGPQTPLPSYFQKKIDWDLDAAAFCGFLRYFDHVLIQGYLLQVYPELNRVLYPDFEATKRRYATLLDLRSPGTLHWLFHLVFPELDVAVAKAPMGRSLVSQSIVLGRTALGEDAIFGGACRVPVMGLAVTLATDEELMRPGRPWPKEVAARLDALVFPLLRAVGVDLTIMLVIRSQQTFAKLHGESYLGYDPIRGGTSPYRRIRIFSGQVA